jgi:hypothetical protein
VLKEIERQTKVSRYCNTMQKTALSNEKVSMLTDRQRFSSVPRARNFVDFSDAPLSMEEKEAKFTARERILNQLQNNQYFNAFSAKHPVDTHR